MNSKRKTAFGANESGLNNHFNQRRGKSDSFILNTLPANNQCKNRNCKNDDLKFSVGGFCIRCVQRVEFIIREKPQTLQRAIKQGATVKC